MSRVYKERCGLFSSCKYYQEVSVTFTTTSIFKDNNTMRHYSIQSVSPRFQALSRSTALLLCCALAACSGSGGSSPAPSAVPAPTPETPVVPVAPPQASRLPHVLSGVPSLLQSPAGVAVDKDGNTFVIDSTRQLVLKITPAGVVTTLAGSDLSYGSQDGQGADASFRFTKNSGMLIDRAGNLIVADTCNFSIRRITPQGMVSTVAGTRTAGCSGHPESRDGVGAGALLQAPESIALDINGDYLVAEGATHVVRRVTQDGTVTTIVWAQPDMSGPTVPSKLRGLAVDRNGIIYFSSRELIYRIKDGEALRWAGTLERSAPDGPRLNAKLDMVTHMAFNASGDLYLSDSSSVRKISSDGIVSTVAGKFDSPGAGDGNKNVARFSSLGALAFDPQGQMIVVDGSVMRKVSMGGDVSTFAATPATSGMVDGPAGVARFQYGISMAADSKGNVYVLDPHANVVRRVSPDGTASLLAGVAGVRNSAERGRVRADAFAEQKSIAVDARDVVYVSDVDRIVRIEDGVLITVVAQDERTMVEHIAVDSVGNIATVGRTGVRVLNPRGDILITVEQSDVAKLAPPARELYGYRPAGVAFDGAGNLYIADLESHTILKRDTLGHFSVFAGTFDGDGNADGAPGKARLGFDGPVHMTFVPNGDMYLTGSGKVRKITPDGTVSTPVLAWGYPSLTSIAYSQKRLLGMTGFAVLETPLPQ
ncbi:hypothetical protein F2P44_10805 [Massilia sp. CCM 8695]|uniref:SMP-30/Gluconolactonase/LRE-like region domain-containing protein n=1 Tax=Massilia frigida TaxID=2609281 RepID=A0ABX0NCQ8_9BURK|nr:hypothetical protein [Massilia frigida]NHZ79763.1 hypothetical protein [Massilia frigida]